MSNFKVGQTVYLKRLIHIGYDMYTQLISTHVVSDVLQTRMYVEDIKNHFYASGGVPHSNWSEFLSSDDKNDNEIIEKRKDEPDPFVEASNRLIREGRV